MESEKEIADKKSILEKLKEVAGGVILFDAQTSEIFVVEENTGRIMEKHKLSDAIKDKYNATIPQNLKLKQRLDGYDATINDPVSQAFDVLYPHTSGHIPHGTYTRILPGDGFETERWTF
jgi:hypothetical protein